MFKPDAATQLKTETAQLIDAISSPAFVDAMHRLNSEPMQSRLALASSILTPDALREAGVPLPPNMRITSRYFEPDSPETIEADDDGNVRLMDQSLLSQPPGAAGAWGCACGGAATVCGGAGGGS